MSTKDRILIVEDEKKIARFLQLELEHEGYECVFRLCQEARGDAYQADPTKVDGL